VMLKFGGFLANRVQGLGLRACRMIKFSEVAWLQGMNVRGLASMYSAPMAIFMN